MILIITKLYQEAQSIYFLLSTSKITSKNPFPGFRVEVSTTNLEKSVSGLGAASNISIQVRAFNEQGFSAPSPPVFCSTHDSSKYNDNETPNAWH